MSSRHPLFRTALREAVWMLPSHGPMVIDWYAQTKNRSAGWEVRPATRRGPALAWPEVLVTGRTSWLPLSENGDLVLYAVLQELFPDE